jgi:hypothetical protein
MAHAFGGFDGGVVCFRVYLEQLALSLKLTKPTLQLLVVHVLKRTKQLLVSPLRWSLSRECSTEAADEC